MMNAGQTVIKSQTVDETETNVFAGKATHMQVQRIWISKNICGSTDLVRNFCGLADSHTLFSFYENLFYKNIEADICEMLRIF